MLPLRSVGTVMPRRKRHGDAVSRRGASLLENVDIGFQSNRRVVTQAAQDEGGSVRFAYHRRAVARRPGPLATGAANRMQL